ncbi:MAG: GLPGLI family protein [Ferruginibacter sp.]
MKKYLFIAFLVCANSVLANAQTFIDKAIIEFEVKTNIQKTMGSSPMAEMMKNQFPKFRTGYYNFIFSGNKSIYKFDHWSEKEKMPDWFRRSEEASTWYFDHDAEKYSSLKEVFGTKFNIADSIQKINWKLVNESRVIAGFNCRKAVGVVMDSVYVFAFYTDEIVISGGPCSIQGLPGMVLGLTIPRLYTSWIATKVMVNTVDEQAIKPIEAKKTFTRVTLKDLINERTKDWGGGDDDEDSRQWMEQLKWNIML